MTDEREAVDGALDALMRAHSAETPSPESDATILAAAHRAVQSAPRPAAEATSPWRWWMPLAAAAVIGVIAIGVLQLMPVDRETAQVMSDTQTAGAPPPVANIQPDVQQSMPPPPPAARAETKPKKEREDRKLVAPAEPERFAATPPPSVAAAPPAADAPAAPAAAMRAAPMQQGPTQWIERIRALLSEGKNDEAAQALAAFRSTYTDADDRLPEDLKRWAATIKR